VFNWILLAAPRVLLAPATRNPQPTTSNLQPALACASLVTSCRFFPRFFPAGGYSEREKRPWRHPKKNALLSALAQRKKKAQWAQQTGAAGAIERTHKLYWQR
jgi:hypothetical protein